MLQDQGGWPVAANVKKAILLERESHLEELLFGFFILPLLNVNGESICSTTIGQWPPLFPVTKIILEHYEHT
ncbi:MAG: hypothetical protein U9P36_00415 [Thermodesulfobacteriota bacterium]|nr:hypothetical protein [Thermodesulfobacteriota bacterium]